MIMLDNVNGEIIGGDELSAHVTYDGRPQGRKIYGSTDDDLRAAAKKEIAKIREGSERWFDGHYADPNLWRIHFHQ
jgi:hypothetical protein